MISQQLPLPLLALLPFSVRIPGNWDLGRLSKIPQIPQILQIPSSPLCYHLMPPSGKRDSGMGRSRKLSPESYRDTDWQLKEYERLMGREAAHRQEVAAREEQGKCICRRRTLRTRGSYRTIHERHCSRYKPWMEEYLKPLDGKASADAHARAIHGDDD